MDPNPQPDDDASMETDSHSFDDVAMEMHADSTDDISMDFDSDYYNRLSKEAFLVDHICQQLERMMSRLVKKEEVGPFTNDVCLLNKWRRDEFKGRKTFTTCVVLVMLEKVIGRDSDVHSDLTAFVPDNPEAIYLSAFVAASVQRLFSNGEQLPPEIEIYLHLLVLVYRIDQHNDDQARDCASASIDRLKHYNRRTFGALAYKHYFYYSLSHERGGDLASIRRELYNLYSLATSHHDELGLDILLNLLLGYYLRYKLYDQAEILREKVLKIKDRSIQQDPLQICRYHFYVGKIQTIRLDYSDARDCLLQEARIAPDTARGFQIQCMKWTLIVQLLLGEIPERTIFTQKEMTNALMPYFELTNAIRIGNLEEFDRVALRHVDTFNGDHTDKLIVRLKHGVIKTRLRNISVSYSRISLADIAMKLGLNNNQNLEYIVAKAIRDGIIDAKLDHANGWMVSKKNEDVYYTNEPQAAFHSRIMACLDLHNKAVQALRFPRNHHDDRTGSRGGYLNRSDRDDEWEDLWWFPPDQCKVPSQYL